MSTGAGLPSFAQERRVRAVCAARGPGRTVLGKTIPLVCRLPAPVDVGAMEQALSAFAGRHAALRHRFVHQDGVVALKPVPALDIRCVVAGADQVHGGADGALRYVREAVDRPFDVLGWPLLRAGVVQADRPLFYLSMDHLVSDAWSTSVAMRELLVLYEAALAGRPATLPPAGDYLRFSAQERHRFAAGPTLDRQVASCQRMLAGRPVHPLFPVSVTPWDITTGRYRRMRLLDRAEAMALLGRCRDAKATAFMWLLAALGTAVRAVSAHPELGVLLAVHNREAPEAAHGVGWYANMLPLYFPVGGIGDFRATLRAVRTGLMGILDHHDLPLARLLSCLPEPASGGDGYPSCFVSFNDDRTQADRRGSWERLYLAPAYRTGYGIWFTLHDDGLEAMVASPDSATGRTRLAELETALGVVLRRTLTEGA